MVVGGRQRHRDRVAEGARCFRHAEVGGGLDARIETPASRVVHHQECGAPGPGEKRAQRGLEPGACQLSGEDAPSDLPQRLERDVHGLHERLEPRIPRRAWGECVETGLLAQPVGQRQQVGDHLTRDGLFQAAPLGVTGVDQPSRDSAS